MRKSVLVLDKKGNEVGRARLGRAAASAATAELDPAEMRSIEAARAARRLRAAAEDLTHVGRTGQWSTRKGMHPTRP